MLTRLPTQEAFQRTEIYVGSKPSPGKAAKKKTKIADTKPFLTAMISPNWPTKKYILPSGLCAEDGNEDKIR